MLLLLACSENEIIAKDQSPSGTLDSSAPEIVVDPLAIDFGEVLAGESASGVVTVSNVGTASLTLGDVLLGVPEVTWTAFASPLVPPGGSVETVLTWTPVVSGPLATTAGFPSNDLDEPRVEVALTGDVPYGDLVVEPVAYDFGELAVGTSATVTLRYTNQGEGPLIVSDRDYVANDGDLRVLDAGAFAALPTLFEAGESTDVVVEYAPSAAGGDEGAISVWSDDPDTPLLVATQNGSGAADDPCEGYSQTVTVMLTADDAWDGWIDGTRFNAPNEDTWSTADTLEWELECGDHTLALYATDLYAAISGVIAVVWVEGSVRFVSGPSNWTITDAAPDATWTEVGFDDTSWNIPQVCSDTSPWGSMPEPFYREGAQWIWWTTQCRDLGEAWLRLNFTVP